MLRKKHLLHVILILVIFISLQLMWWLLMGLTVKRLTYMQPFNQQQARELSYQLAFLVRWYPTISLGTYRIPPIHTQYKLIGSVDTTITEGFRLVDQGQSLMTTMFHGEESDWELWQRFWSQGTVIYRLIEELAARTGNDRLETILPMLKPWLSYEEGLKQLLGFDRPKHYVVLFQNNMELRPTGGFLGSYAQFWLHNGALTNLAIQDIYVPDGQIKGYVKEPEPISTYLFGGDTPGWRLRDSNWEPDFPSASKTMKWFFEEGELQPIDGIIGINLHLILDVLAVVGPISLPDYSLIVSKDTFYQQAQYAAEHNFFPGSTQKGDFLRTVGQQLLFTFMNDPQTFSLQLAPSIMDHLTKRNITVALFDEESQALFRANHWDGSIREFEGDYLYINEANLGINKTNCCVDRNFSLSITPLSNGGYHHTLSLTYINNNPRTPQPPVAWGGGYKNYLRIYAPNKATLKEVIVEGRNITSEVVVGEEYGKVYFGFISLTEGGDTGRIEVRYTLPPDVRTSNEYILFLQKQPGIESIPYRITWESGAQTYEEAIELTTDRIVRFPVVY